jgi:hypothetical protein
MAPFSKGINAASRGAALLGTAIEGAGTAYQQKEREFGLTEEDLGTLEGRKRRVGELKALAIEKGKIIKAQRARAELLKQAISKLDKAIVKLRRARDRQKGAKRAKMTARIRPIMDRRADLAAELVSLGSEIRDMELDIGDLAKEAGEVAATADTEVEPDTRAVDKLGQFLGDIDLAERAGVMSPEAAKAMKVQALQLALQGVGGPLSDRQRLEVMAQLREATVVQAEAVVDNTSALKDLNASIQAQLAFANGVAAITSMEAVRAMADVMSGQLGYQAGKRALMPGSGQLSRL